MTYQMIRWIVYFPNLYVSYASLLIPGTRMTDRLGFCNYTDEIFQLDISPHPQ